MLLLWNQRFGGVWAFFYRFVRPLARCVILEWKWGLVVGALLATLPCVWAAVFRFHCINFSLSMLASLWIIFVHSLL
jgi:hypothetical protein